MRIAIYVESILKDINLEHLLETFEAVAVDLKMLLSFNKSDMNECMKDVGIKKFGERHRIVEKITHMKPHLSKLGQKVLIYRKKLMTQKYCYKKLQMKELKFLQKGPKILYQS